MTNSETSSLHALTALLEERQKYEGWLHALELKRSEAPSHVLDKVRGDYLARLHTVTEQMSGRAGELESSAATLAGQIAVLLSEETDHRDERSEAELRSAVGEYTPEQAAEALGRCDEAIGRLSGERSALGAELAKVQGILVLVTTPIAIADATATPTADASVHNAAAGAQPERDVEQDRIPAGMADNFDELAFLQSVVEPSSEAPPLAADASTVDATPEPVINETITHEAATAEELLPHPVLSSVRRQTPPLGSNMGGSREPFGSSSRSTLTPGSIPSFLKDMPTEQVKTLKCQECGTMNYPTEWYCERCGGELAAM